MDELRVAIDCCPDQKAQKRLNAIHLMLCGGSFDLALAHSGDGERCLQRWISEFNRRGIDGISYRPSPGRARLMAPAEVGEKIAPVVDDPSLAGQYHWTVTKLCGWLRDCRGIALGYRTLLRYLHEQGYVRRIPRRMPEPPDREIWEQRRRDFAPVLAGLLGREDALVFFGDESVFEGDPRPRQRWVKRGSRPEQGYYGGHVRRNVVGAVAPATGQVVSLIVEHCDSPIFQAFLDTMAEEVPARPGKEVYLVLDNASWHKAKCLRWHHIQPLFLPPYSPDFNPIERLWQHLKSNHMAGFLTGCGKELEDRLFDSIRELIKDTETIRSVCKPTTL